MHLRLSYDIWYPSLAWTRAIRSGVEETELLYFSIIRSMGNHFLLHTFLKLSRIPLWKELARFLDNLSDTVWVLTVERTNSLQDNPFFKNKRICKTPLRTAVVPVVSMFPDDLQEYRSDSSTQRWLTIPVLLTSRVALIGEGSLVSATRLQEGGDRRGVQIIKDGVMRNLVGVWIRGYVGA